MTYRKLSETSGRRASRNGAEHLGRVGRGRDWGSIRHALLLRLQMDRKDSRKYIYYGGRGIWAGWGGGGTGAASDTPSSSTYRWTGKTAGSTFTMGGGAPGQGGEGAGLGQPQTRPPPPPTDGQERQPEVHLRWRAEHLGRGEGVWVILGGL
jgi:hypothetical protein